MKRKIELDIEVDEANSREQKLAVGNLVVWGLSDYDEVSIHTEKPGELDMIAVYKSSVNPDMKYVIGAIWHPGTKEFSFHS